MHGTRSSYNRGCRCDDCRRANTEAQRRRRGAVGSRAPVAEVADGAGPTAAEKPPPKRHPFARRRRSQPGVTPPTLEASESEPRPREPQQPRTVKKDARPATDAGTPALGPAQPRAPTSGARSCPSASLQRHRLVSFVPRWRREEAAGRRGVSRLRPCPGRSGGGHPRRPAGRRVRGPRRGAGPGGWRSLVGRRALPRFRMTSDSTAQQPVTAQARGGPERCGPPAPLHPVPNPRHRPGPQLLSLHVADPMHHPARLVVEGPVGKQLARVRIPCVGSPLVVMDSEHLPRVGGAGPQAAPAPTHRRRSALEAARGRWCSAAPAPRQ